MIKSSTLIALASLMVRPATLDAWRSAYEAGLQAAHSGNWTEARANFKKAEESRPRDSDRPSSLSGSKEKWRKGAPYSPNFLAAYSEYRIALDCKDSGEQKKDFLIAQAEFGRLINAGQRSRDAVFYLDLIDTRLNDQSHRAKMGKQMGPRNLRFSWKVDEDSLAPEEIAAMQLFSPAGSSSQGAMTTASTGYSKVIKAGELTTGTVGTAMNPIIPGLPGGGVPLLPDKFALLIGQDSSQASAQACASYDAKTIRDSLVQYAGYDPKNVVLIQNSTAASVMEQAKALAAMVPQDGVVLVYYAGAGSSVQGKDYLAASDTTSRYDTETMISKSALYNLFMQKGARIFSFYEVDRPIESGYFFGSEVPQSGAISQMEATIPDKGITTTVANGHPIGLYANAFVQVLAELQSNRIPINEFGWQIYAKMKRGNSGTTGGGVQQTPTLPVLNNLASDARF